MVSVTPPTVCSATPPPPPPMSTTTRTANTKRHWRVLRNALLSKTRDGSVDVTASSAASEFFPKFSSRVLPDDQRDGLQAQENFAWVKYDIHRDAMATKGKSDARTIVVHEKQQHQRVSIAELLSHQLNNGVDNTGNIRTWPSEQILLAHVLRTRLCESLAAASGGHRIRCCELGAGMAGLAALGLLAHDAQFIARMLVTDGNPSSVKNLQLCVDGNRSHGSFGVVTEETQIDVALLRWDRTMTPEAADRHQFDLILASDCLFFEDFHEDLAATIHSLLRPRTGRCLLLQPRRNGSMERFCMVATASRGLTIRQVDDFDPELTRLHAEYQRQQRAGYVADVHRPILLEITSTAVENTHKTTSQCC